MKTGNHVRSEVEDVDTVCGMNDSIPLFSPVSPLDHHQTQTRLSIEKNTVSDMNNGIALLSPVSPPDHHHTLTQLAKENNIKIVDVPGDGNCFYHAVSLSLQSAGIQEISASEIRCNLANYLDTEDSKRNFVMFFSASRRRKQLRLSLVERQSKQYDNYIDDLKKGAWAENLAV